MEFVIDVLQNSFSYDVECAMHLMLLFTTREGHLQSLPPRLRINQVAMADKMRRENQHPLRVRCSLNAGIKIGGGAYAQSRTGMKLDMALRQSA
ncbi:ATP-dependent Clp protease adaptor ClpS [Shigella boydii]